MLSLLVKPQDSHSPPDEVLSPWLLRPLESSKLLPGSEKNGRPLSKNPATPPPKPRSLRPLIPGPTLTGTFQASVSAAVQPYELPHAVPESSSTEARSVLPSSTP